MKTFLAIYLGSESSPAGQKWEAMDDKTREKQEEAGISAWMKWATENQKQIINIGSPIGKTKLVNSKGVSNIVNQITAYTIVQAENHEAAAKLFVNHPHFTIFPGESVEIMECLPMPEMPIITK